MLKILLAINQPSLVQPIVDYFGNIEIGTTDVEFIILCVVEPALIGSYLSILPSAYLEELMQVRRWQAKEVTDSLSQGLSSVFRQPFNLKVLVLEGAPASTIIDTAREHQVDVILLGSHHRHGLAQILEGSVSSAVAEKSTSSIVIIPHIAKSARSESSSAMSKNT